VIKEKFDQFEPYFSDNCCFLESLKKSIWPKKPIYGTIFTPKKPMKEPISPKKSLIFTSLTFTVIPEPKNMQREIQGEKMQILGLHLKFFRSKKSLYSK